MKEKYPGIDVRAYYEEIDANIKPSYWYNCVTELI